MIFYNPCSTHCEVKDAGKTCAPSNGKELQQDLPQPVLLQSLMRSVVNSKPHISPELKVQLNSTPGKPSTKCSSYDANYNRRRTITGCPTENGILPLPWCMVEMANVDPELFCGVPPQPLRHAYLRGGQRCRRQSAL